VFVCFWLGGGGGLVVVFEVCFVCFFLGGFVGGVVGCCFGGGGFIGFWGVVWGSSFSKECVLQGKKKGSKESGGGLVVQRGSWEEGGEG